MWDASQIRVNIVSVLRLHALKTISVLQLFMVYPLLICSVESLSIVNIVCRSLMFFKGNNKGLVDQELSHLQSQINRNPTDSTKKPTLCDLFKDCATRKGIIISFGLLGGQQLGGIFAMVSRIN